MSAAMFAASSESSEHNCEEGKRSRDSLPRLNCPFQISAARDHLLRESICVEGRACF
jgi:hypothetical protein